jgi:uncharacterized protein (DUF1499 family)
MDNVQKHNICPNAHNCVPSTLKKEKYEIAAHTQKKKKKETSKRKESYKNEDNI